MNVRYPTSDMVFRSKDQRSSSRVEGQKHIEGDRVAGVSLHHYRVPINFLGVLLLINKKI